MALNFIPMPSSLILKQPLALLSAPATHPPQHQEIWYMYIASTIGKLQHLDTYLKLAFLNIFK